MSRSQLSLRPAEGIGWVEDPHQAVVGLLQQQPAPPKLTVHVRDAVLSLSVGLHVGSPLSCLLNAASGATTAQRQHMQQEFRAAVEREACRAGQAAALAAGLNPSISIFAQHGSSAAGKANEVQYLVPHATAEAQVAVQHL